MLTDSQRTALISRLRRGRENAYSGIPCRPDGLAELPLSYGQEQLWFIDRFAPGQPTYNIPLAIAVSGPLDRPALGRALGHLVARHEALRTRLAAGEQGRPVQIIDRPASQALDLTDLSGLEPDQRPARLAELIRTRAHEPFTLASDRLLRTHLLRLTGNEHVLLIVVHHAVFDGWSAGVLLREIAAFYRQEAGGEPAALAPLPVQFADYALWERERLQGAMLAELESYWRETMDGFGTVQFPADRPRPVLDEFDGGLVQQMTSRGLLDRLRELSRLEGTTLFVTLMAALHALVCRYTGQTDLVIGTVSANRAEPELISLVGFLVNTLPIRADLSGDPPFTELLALVHQASVGAFAHQDLPFGKLVDSLRVQRDPSRAPVFQIALVHAERDAAAVQAAGVAFRLTDLVVGIDAAKFDLSMLAEARADGLWLECSYKTALFDSATVRRLVAHYEVLLHGIVADPSARLSALPVLTGAELHSEITEWNDTAGPVPSGCVHHGFEKQAAATPEAVAAEFGAQRVSYAELNRQANQIARRLRGLGVGPETLVGVCMTTSLRRLAALFGIWKAGAGYVPLDPALPTSRLAFMAADAAMAVILTDQQSADKVPDGNAAGVLSLDAGWDQISALNDSNLPGPPVPASNVAYVIYTSGSTGRPKGVLIEHRQVTNMVAGLVGNWQIGPADVVLQYASLSFDVSVLDMFVPLLAGARVVLVPPPVLQSPRRLAALIRERGVTFACLTPSVAGLLADERFSDLRALLTAGEELPSEVAKRWLRPGLRFANAYGPTEATVLASYAELDESMSPPIGLPIRPNYRCYVLDPYLNPVPVGVTGELHIGGACLARGYLNRPALTAQRFIADPFTPGERTYKSGDLVRRRPGGAIVFIGRIDHQVKIRGLRIELGEIETALTAHPGVAQAVVTVLTDPAGERQLAGYVRPEPGTAPGPAELRAHLARTLPGYMIPAHLTAVGEFRLTANGKIDRAVLPSADQQRATAEPAAPATQTETTLVGLYATVLGRAQVGAADGFFDIGGSSLQVMRLVDLIGRETGVDIGAATVFLHPAPRQLAARIDAIRSGTGQAGGPGPLVELSTDTGDLPLVLIHPIGGTVFGYSQLAGELDGTFSVRGLQAPGLTGGGDIADSLADLVTDYTERIRAAQPAGPYRLAGWSMGGVIAFEIARRLELSGAQVSLLVLLDAPFAVPADYLPPPAQLAGRFLADVAHSLGWNPAELPDPATSAVAGQLSWLAARLSTGAQADDDDQGTGWLRQRFDVFSAHTAMIAGYQPAAPAVQAPALIISADQSQNAPARERWPQVLAGPVATHRIAADHYTFLRPPLVADICTTIVKWHADTGQATSSRSRGC